MRPENLPRLQRLLAMVELGEPPPERPELGPCWVWAGYCDAQGYARHREGRKLYRVHRTFFVLLGSNLPLLPDQVLDHLCRRRACVCPAHLEPVTSRQNTLRGIAARQAGASLRLPFPQA